MIRVKGVSKRFADLEVLKEINLEVSTGQFLAIVGPSGSGKSTLLRMLAGLDKPTEGEVLIGGEKVTGPDPSRNLVFQEDALLPWRTVRGNVALGLELRAVPAKQSKERIEKWLELVGLGSFADFYPHQLSGGMRQRVSLARALVLEPQLLLLDEPFGALDALTRLEMQHELLNLWQHRKMTVVLITHDVEEALYLADAIAVMTKQPGQIIEEITVAEPRPRDRGSAQAASTRRRILNHLGLA